MIVLPTLREIRTYTVGPRRRELREACDRYEAARRTDRERIERARLVGGLMNSYRYAAAGIGTTPDTIFDSDLVAWYKIGTGIYNAISGGSLVSSDNEEVGRWEDASGNGYHALRHTSTSTSSLPWKTGTTFRGVGTVLFSAGGYLEIPGAVGSAMLAAGAGAMMIAFKTSGGSNGAWDFSASDFSSHFPYSNGEWYEGFGATARKPMGAIPDTTTAFHSMCIASSTNISGYIDDSLIHSEGIFLTFRSSGIKFGESQSSTYKLGAFVSEIVIVQRVPSSDERTAMDTYLRGL